MRRKQELRAGIVKVDPALHQCPSAVRISRNARGMGRTGDGGRWRGKRQFPCEKIILEIILPFRGSKCEVNVHC